MAKTNVVKQAFFILFGLYDIIAPFLNILYGM
jgi:hypothetical protein